MATFAKSPCDEGVIRSAPKALPCTPHVGVWVLVATILGSSMAFIDGSVVNVALPIIQRDLNATTADVQWIVETYALFLAALILVGGSLGDHFGRRRIFAIGISVFILASIWGGLSPTVLSLILARAVQGIGAALLVPGSLAIISASFSDEQRGRAIGTWSGFSALTTVVGPVLGGVLVQYASWRSVFFPFDLIQVQGYAPTFAGAAFVPLILLMFLLSRWAGGLVHRYGAKLPLVVGPMITAVGFTLFALPGITSGPGSYWITFFPAVLVMGLGMTITVAPLTTAVMGAVEQRHAGIASGINNAVSRTAGLLAIAVFGIVALAVFTSSLESHLATLHLSPSVQQLIDAQRTRLAGITIPTSVSAETQAALKRASDESFVSAFRLVSLLGAALAVLSALSAWLLIEGKQPERAGGPASASPASIAGANEQAPQISANS